MPHSIPLPTSRPPSSPYPLTHTLLFTHVMSLNMTQQDQKEANWPFWCQIEQCPVRCHSPGSWSVPRCLGSWCWVVQSYLSLLQGVPPRWCWQRMSLMLQECHPAAKNINSSILGNFSACVNPAQEIASALPEDGYSRHKSSVARYNQQMTCFYCKPTIKCWEYLCLCFSVCLSVCLSVSLHFSVCLSLSLCIFPS